MSGQADAIALDGVVVQHAKKDATNSERAMWERVFFLCINKEFRASVAQIREEIMRLPELGNKLKLPSNEVALVIESRKKIYQSQKLEWYKNRFKEIAHSHNLIGASYIPLTLTHHETEVGISDYDMTLLERIVFYNDPLYRFFEKSSGGRELERFAQISNPFGLLGSLSIATDNSAGTNEKYIEGRFDLNISKTEMLQVIEEEFEKVQKMRERIFGIPAKRAHRKDDLRHIYEIHKLAEMGERPLTIAAIMANWKHMGHTSKDVSEQAVKDILKKTATDTRQFNKKVRPK